MKKETLKAQWDESLAPPAGWFKILVFSVVVLLSKQLVTLLIFVQLTSR